MSAREVRVEPEEEPGHVGRGDPVPTPMAGRRLEVAHSGLLRDLLEALVADASVDGVSGTDAEVRDHRLEERLGLAVEGQSLALEPPQFSHEQQRLADARGA